MAREAIDLTVSGPPAHDDLAALRAKLWYPDVDGVLFDEAVRCFEQTAYRAALVMTWLAIAEGLRHRFEVAAQRDLELTSLLEEVAQREKDRYAIDTFLLDKARKHELISEHEYRELVHIRDQRNRFAHPGGASPSRAQVLAALDTAVHIVLCRPAQHRTEWTAALVMRAATDRTFFPRDPDALRAYAREIDPLLTREARQHLLRAAVKKLDELAADPARSDLAAKVTILAGAILEMHTALMGALDPAARLAARERGMALVCLRPEVFAGLDGAMAGAALASVLEPPADASPDWQPDIRVLIAVQELHEVDSLPPVWAEQLDKLGFVGTVEDLLADLPVGILVRDLHGTIAVGVHRDDADGTWKDAGHSDARREILESHHVPLAGQIGGIGPPDHTLAEPSDDGPFAGWAHRASGGYASSRSVAEKSSPRHSSGSSASLATA